MKLNKKIIFLLKVSISLLFISLILIKLDLGDIADLFMKLDSLTAVVIFLLLILMIFLGSVSLLVLLIASGYRVSMADFFRIYFVTWGISNLVPAKAGELLFFPFLKDKGVPYGKSAAVLMIDKLITMMTLAMLSLAASFLFFGIKVFILALVVVSAGFAVALWMIYSGIARKMIRRYILRKHSSKFRGFYKLSILLFRKKKAHIAANFAVTFIRWFITALSFYAVLASFGIVVSVIDIYLITSVLTMVSLFPLTINGLGLREYVSTLLYPLIGVSPTQIITVYIILNARNYLLTLIPLAIYWSRK